MNKIGSKHLWIAGKFYLKFLINQVCLIATDPDLNLNATRVLQIQTNFKMLVTFSELSIYMSIYVCRIGNFGHPSSLFCHFNIGRKWRT